jgi:hypothetical protein
MGTVEGKASRLCQGCKGPLSASVHTECCLVTLPLDPETLGASVLPQGQAKQA